MSGKRNGRAVGRKKPDRTVWLRQQAIAQQQKAAKTVEATGNKQQAVKVVQDMVSTIVKLNTKVQTLAAWHADRCARIVELRAELHAEWELRIAAEERVHELEQARQEAIKAAAPAKRTVAKATNGRAKTPAKAS